MASITTPSTPSTNTVVQSSLLALTTPFTPPAPSCTGIFTTTNAVSSYFFGHHLITTTLTVVYSDPSNPSFTQCQPRGWDEVVPESRFHFSPAVCPNQWTAYYLKDVYVDLQPSLTRRATTAYCCASGYNLDDPGLTLQSLSSQELACVSAIGVKAISSTTTASVTETLHPFPNGIQIHKAYHISWDETDKPTLSPTPPDFSYGCSATLDMWVPGESVDPLPCNNQTGDGGGVNKAAVTVFMMVGIPVIVVVLIATCCGYYCRKSRRKQRAFEKAMRDQNSAGRELVDNPGEQGGGIKT
ncbi:hypothetical protein V492_02461 [Pseudogymnoascus sp. VKM F-4246]|nr:hypothetical protein V492_02461 [Pseudogymnoascus sp. VKM F-4246]